MTILFPPGDVRDNFFSSQTLSIDLAAFGEYILGVKWKDHRLGGIYRQYSDPFLTFPSSLALLPPSKSAFWASKFNVPAGTQPNAGPARVTIFQIGVLPGSRSFEYSHIYPQGK